VSGPDRFARAVAEHREAVAACVAAIRSVAPEDWNRSPAEKKWTPAEIAEHLTIAYEPGLSELDGGPGMRIVFAWWKRRLLRWVVLPRILRGGFPSGAPAPREVRPVGGARDTEEAIRRLSGRADEFLDRLTRADAQGAVRISHAYFGRLSGLQALKVLTSHANHHRKQFPAGAERRR
jgi:hypothetical protein